MSKRPRRLDPAADLSSCFEPAGAAPSAFATALEKHLAPQVNPAPPPPLPLPALRKASPPPQADLDCHGLTSAEAEQRLHWFLDRARHQGLRTVRIITGKGLHSQGGPVLPGVVEVELRLLKKQGRIAGFHWERKERQRSGAVIVYL